MKKEAGKGKKALNQDRRSKVRLEDVNQARSQQKVIDHERGPENR
ncbi:MAG: hypothetical protein ACYC2T_14780 [Bacillota bacterium]